MTPRPQPGCRRNRDVFGRLAALIALWLVTGLLPVAEAKSLELRKGDHIAIIGNTLPDRMQHDGWLETYFQSRFPDREIVVRDLGYSGDEIEQSRRIRSTDFGSPDHWLTFTRADIVFAFFGYNESFRGKEGLDGFKRELESLVKHTLTQKYNGKSIPTLVLFSPIAFEDHHSKVLPSGAEANENIAIYVKAMQEVAEKNGALFVDLYGPSHAFYAKSSKPLTINGVHLTEEGNRLIAQEIDRALFPGDEPRRDAKALESLRQAVLDKNFHWFNRYRTVDGYSIYGGRADLRFVGGQTNRVVAQREMEVLDVMTANRDKRIWAVAQGRDLKVDDSNTPPYIEVKTNKPGNGPNGAHVFLGGEEAIGKMTIGKGLKVNLFASEEKFPEIAKPVQMAFDPKGRLWVAAWPTYPHWKPKEPMNDKLVILEDTDGDGKADRTKIFVDDLHCPTGFEFWNGGVLVAQAPDLVFLKDTDGDDKADLRVRVLSGLDSADTHHTSNSFFLDPGGALYFQEGTFHHSQVETPYGPPERCANAGVFRYEPRTQKFDVYVTFGFANPHGHVFDSWGQDFMVDGTGANPYHATLFSGHMDYPQKHGQPPQLYPQRTRPCPGIEYLTSRHFPEEMQGNLIVPNVIAFQGILRYRIDDKDSSFAGTELEPILSSTDPNFRPADVEMGPDGAIYFVDWQNPIIGHMQHNLRDPSRDHTHGRVYRVTYEGRPLLTPPKIAGVPVDKLLDLLKEPEDRVRSRARIELSGRDPETAVAATKKWIAALDKADPNYAHQRLEGLWVLQSFDAVDRELLESVLRSPDFHARAAATKVLCYWRDRVPNALELLKKQAADAYPRVRLEAVRAASFFTEPEAVEVALISAEHPSDEYIEFTRGETMKTLEPHWKKAVAEGRSINFTSEAGARFFLKSVSNDELLKLKRSKPVYVELLFRPGIRDEYRREALQNLAKLEDKSELRVLIEAIRSQDDQKGHQDESVVFDLSRLLTGRDAKQLAGERESLQALALSAKMPVTRQLGFVALIATDGDIGRAWALANRSETSMEDLLTAMPLIRDPSLRAALYPKVEPLLTQLPKNLEASKVKGTRGRYVRVELRGHKTLTLAEVEVYSDGRNAARLGKASQKNTAYGGEARRAIDGNKDSSFGAGGQTHTEENTSDPWWEVDLGAEVPIDSIAVYNRTDGSLGNRLNGFTLKVLDASRRVVFEKTNQKAPEPKVAYEFDKAGRQDTIRRAAMNALTYVRGEEGRTFKTLGRFVREDVDREAAIRALQRIPVAEWPKEEVRPLLDSLLAYIGKLPAQERTSPVALDALQLGDSLAALLPVDQARQARRQLGELGVRVIRIGTLPEQMLYDKERFAVQAGKPVEVLFENNDTMPHNFVVVQPGSLEEIGLLGESTATQPGSVERNYVPPSNKILLSSRLIQPRDVDKLDFTAPRQPGVYPYVCTYPGHWRRMYGSMYVVEDLEQYLADPEAYLASHPLPIRDELLKFNRPRKEWTLDDLASTVEQMDHGRSFGNAKQIFQVATCVACHRVNGVGSEIGPDLTKLDPKTKPVDILRSILIPSEKIDEKYVSHTIATDDGKVITGLVVEETPELVKVIENPLVKADPIVLKKSEIAERKKSPTSIMPKGLLDKLTREEILDLIAYVAARGKEGDPLFHGEQGHDHAHGSGH